MFDESVDRILYVHGGAAESSLGRRKKDSAPRRPPVPNGRDERISFLGIHVHARDEDVPASPLLALRSYDAHLVDAIRATQVAVVAERRRHVDPLRSACEGRVRMCGGDERPDRDLGTRHKEKTDGQAISDLAPGKSDGWRTDSVERCRHRGKTFWVAEPVDHVYCPEAGWIQDRAQLRLSDSGTKVNVTLVRAVGSAWSTPETMYLLREYRSRHESLACAAAESRARSVPDGFSGPPRSGSTRRVDAGAGDLAARGEIGLAPK